MGQSYIFDQEKDFFCHHILFRNKSEKNFQQDRISRLFSMKIKFTSKMLRMKCQINKVWNKQKEQITLWMLCKLVISAYLMLNNYREFWKKKKMPKNTQTINIIQNVASDMRWRMPQCHICWKCHFQTLFVIFRWKYPKSAAVTKSNITKLQWKQMRFCNARVLWKARIMNMDTHTHIFMAIEKRNCPNIINIMRCNVS